MLSRKRLLRVGLWLATTSLSLTSAVPVSAQPAPLPGESGPGEPGPSEQAGEPNSEPPALVGRLAAIAGSVSFHAAGETQWNPATLNYPVTSGLSFWTEPQASATLEIADDSVVLDDSTELDVGTLDQSQFSVTEPQGAVFLQLNSLPPGQAVSVTTPRGAVQISATGRYEIVAGDTNDATTVSVVEGAAHVEGTNLSLDIGPQQTATIGGSDTLQGSVGALQQDAFLQAQLRVPAPRREAAIVPQQVQYMTGGQELQQYGSWNNTTEYGQVWYPNDVASNWAPYREGHWAYVQPWGWTWVDNARWGFAPFHYGRWVQVNDRWGWVAGGGGPVEGGGWPVYSPALVTFLDVGGAALAGAAIGFGVGELAGGFAPAWIPLGPREPYYPWYHVRGDYFERINRPYGVPQDILRRGPTFINNVTENRITFINRRAATVVPAGAFARGEAIGHFGRPLPERALAEARPVGGRLAVRPTAFTPNLAPAAARRFGVTPAVAAARVVAGPRIEVGPVRAHAMPELRRAAVPGNIHAVPAAEAAHAAERPGERAGLPVVHGPEGRPGGLPPLRAPGARPEALPGTGGERPGVANERRFPGAGEPEGRPLPQVHQPTGSVAEHGREARPTVPQAREPLRTPEAGRPEARRPEPARPEAARPEAARPEAARPEAARPEAARPEAARPEAARPEAARPELGRSEAPRPRAEEHREAPKPEARPEMPRVQEPHEAPRPEARREPAARPAPAPREAAPHPEAARPAPRPAAPHPAPHPEKRPDPR